MKTCWRNLYEKFLPIFVKICCAIINPNIERARKDKDDNDSDTSSIPETVKSMSLPRGRIL